MVVFVTLSFMLYAFVGKTLLTTSVLDMTLNNQTARLQKY